MRTLDGPDTAPTIDLTPRLLCGEVGAGHWKSATGRQGLLVFVAVLLGGQLVMKLAAAIARSASGEQASSAHQWRCYTNGQRMRAGGNVGMAGGLFATMLERAETTEAIGFDRSRLHSSPSVRRHIRRLLCGTWVSKHQVQSTITP